MRDRGYIAAVVAGMSFFVAAMYPIEWRIEEFSAVVAAAMVPAVVILAVLSMRRFAFLDQLAAQHRSFGVGPFCCDTPTCRADWSFAGLVVLMFAVCGCVGITGLLASFLSTALALYSEGAGLSLVERA